MIFQTVTFFIFIIDALICFILAILNRDDDNRAEVFLTILLIGISVVTFLLPNKTTTFLESDYNIYEMIEETNYKVTTEPLLTSETTNYVEFKEYIFNRKKLVLHINNEDKYISTEFTKYKK